MTTMFCPECGAPAHDRFCGGCGTALPQEAEAAANTAAAPEYAVGTSGDAPRSADPGTASMYMGRGATDAGPRDPRRRAGWVLTFVAVVVLAAGAFAAWRGLIGGAPSAEPAASSSHTRASSAPQPTTTTPATSLASPTPSEPDERVRGAASSVDALLSRSADQRAKLQRATASCKRDPLGAARDLQEVVEGRRSLLQEAQAAPFADLPRGNDMKAALQRAWAHSLEADERFLDWVRTDASCSERSPSFRAGFEASRSAQAAKKTFAQLWESAVRQPQGLPTARSTANI